VDCDCYRKLCFVTNVSVKVWILLSMSIEMHGNRYRQEKKLNEEGWFACLRSHLCGHWIDSFKVTSTNRLKQSFRVRLWISAVGVTMKYKWIHFLFFWLFLTFSYWLRERCIFLLNNGKWAILFLCIQAFMFSNS